MLRYFPDLVSADFSGSTCYEEIARWAQENPQVQVRYSIPLPNGSVLENDAESLDLSWMKTADVPAVADAISRIDSIKNIELGTIGTEELELGALADLKAAAPEAQPSASALPGDATSPSESLPGSASAPWASSSFCASSLTSSAHFSSAQLSALPSVEKGAMKVPVAESLPVAGLFKSASNVWSAWRQRMFSV